MSGCCENTPILNLTLNPVEQCSEPSTPALNLSLNPVQNCGQGGTNQSGNGVSTFLQLLDTPNVYIGSGDKLVAVKEDESGLEFIDKPQALVDPFSKVIVTAGAGVTVISIPWADYAVKHGTEPCEIDLWLDYQKTTCVVKSIDGGITYGAYIGASSPRTGWSFKIKGFYSDDIPPEELVDYEWIWPENL